MDASGKLRRWDSKRINRAVFGVFYEEDIYDKFCKLLPRVMRAFWWRIDPAIVGRSVLFVHVPRVAGTSIANALYGGDRTTRHHSARYYRTVNPAFFAAVESFALLRDPFDRFLSAYAFVRDGGTPTCRLSDVFRNQTAHIASVDDYLDFLESRAPHEMDFTMRPQSWFICDAGGAPLVKTLFLYGEDNAALVAYLRAHGAAALPWLNGARRMPLDLTPRQCQRIVALYADDFTLIGALRAQRAREAAASRVAETEAAMRIAAE